MEDYFVCDHCRKKHDIRKKRSGVVMIGRVIEDRNTLDQVIDLFSDIEITKYEINKNSVTLSICQSCIDESIRKYDLNFWLAIVVSLFLLLIQFYVGFLWYLLAPGGIILTVAIKIRMEDGRHWKDVADRLAKTVMEKRLERQMEKDSYLKILTREEYSRLI